MTHDLVENGSEVEVTRDNFEGGDVFLAVNWGLMWVADYVRRVTEFVLEESVAAQYAAFEEGFHSVCGTPALGVCLLGYGDEVCFA